MYVLTELISENVNNLIDIWLSELFFFWTLYHPEILLRAIFTRYLPELQSKKSLWKSNINEIIDIFTNLMKLKITFITKYC